MQAIDLFSGAGGMSSGAVAAGVTVRYAVEFDQRAATTFQLNHPETVMFTKDIRKVRARDFIGLDRTEPLVIFGGPPCQGFSTSNQTNRDAENANNWLFRDYLRLVRGVKPDWVVFENVKGLIETENGFFLEAVLKGLKGAGYKLNHFVLNSAEYGVPQRRNRLFIVGSLNGTEISAPEKENRSQVTVADAFADLPELENGATTDELPYKELATSFYAKELRQSLTKCSGHLVTSNAKHIVERYEHIPPGGNWEDIPLRLMKNYTDVSRCHTGIYRRLKAEEPSVVIGNFRKNMLIHPWKDRGLSVREAARLQSFPDSFRFAGSIGFQQQQVGNAVPPALSRSLFKHIIAHC
jgi:DNA (cytosine-5)-methyltransferase 1